MGSRIQILHFLLCLSLLTACSTTPAALLAPATQYCAAVADFQQPVCWYDSAPTDRRRPVLVLVHGVGEGASSDWRYVWTDLIREFRVLAIDLPGYGDSAAAPSDQLTPSAYARALDQLISRSTDAPVVLAGHSMGGTVVLRYAIEYPAKVERVVLVDVAGVLQRFAFTKYIVGSRAGDPGEAWESRGFLNRMFTKAFEVFESASSRIGTRHEKLLLREFSSAREASAYHAANENFAGQLRRIEAPALIVWGRLDEVAPLRSARLLHQQLPHAQLKILPEVGHSPLQQAPRQLLDLILRFTRFEPIAGLAPSPWPGKDVERPEPEGQHEHSTREGYCVREADRVFSGRYRKLDIRHCKRVILQQVEVDELVLFESRVVIRDSRVGSQESDVALRATGSEVYLDNVQLSGRLPVEVARSRLDMAGVKLHSSGPAAVQSSQSSNLIFSLSNLINANHQRRWLHGFWDLERGQQL